MDTYFTQDELDEIASQLVDYHSLFYTFWSVSSISFSDDTNTACVNLTPGIKPEIKINKIFWDNSTSQKKIFIIIHECLHALLNHGFRSIGIKDTANNINIAQDIVINELSVDMFDVVRENINGWKKLCWIDTAFKKPNLILRNETFKYYLDLLVHEKQSTEPETLDDHGEGGSCSGIPQEVLDTLSQEELEKLIKASGLNPSNSDSPLSAEFNKRIEMKKVSFKKLVRNFKRSSLSSQPSEKYTFVETSRRFSTFRGNTQLPGDHSSYSLQKNKLNALLFMDVSGSCSDYFKQFELVANTFYADPEFKTQLFGFDTKVKPIEIGKSLKIGGGTSFSCIESFINSNFTKYPDVVLVVTDGFAANFSCSNPKKWIWLLTDYSSNKVLPPQSKVEKITKLGFKF